MNHSRPFKTSFGALGAVALLVLACTTGVPATSRPTGVPTPPVSATLSAAPTAGTSTVPTAEPGASLDPSLSEQGIVARVTITSDSRDPGAPRDGTHEMIAMDADSGCSPNLSDPTYTAVAWWADAPNGKIHRFSVSVPSSAIPTEEETTSDIADGSVSFDFVSETGVGTQYTGAALRADQGSSTIDVTRDGDALIFDFEGETWDEVLFAGELICADV